MSTTHLGALGQEGPKVVLALDGRQAEQFAAHPGHHLPKYELQALVQLHQRTLSIVRPLLVTFVLPLECLERRVASRGQDTEQWRTG